MDKAFDVKALGSRLKGRGLDLAEEAAVIVIEEVFGWAEESVTLSENKIDDLALAVLPTLKKLALEGADKIDGKQDAAPAAPAS